ncbi:MAG: hypothetical protein MUF35_02030 [Candidatus Nanopelagicales bacterium]|jgi:hypothetical protein|nr:hypothetical protein [Candidatus Nanopelagicales bacterium]
MAPSVGSTAAPAAVAHLDVEGRRCAVRPLRGTGLGSVCGPAAVVDSLEALRTTTGWLPGRVLVLGEGALQQACLAHLDSLPAGTFAAIVALTEDVHALAGLRLPGGRTPAVAVTRPADREMVRRGILICVTVSDRPEQRHPIPAPRRPRRRTAGGTTRSRVPGTIDLRGSTG